MIYYSGWFIADVSFDERFGIFEKICQLLARHCEVCNGIEGGTFQDLL